MCHLFRGGQFGPESPGQFPAESLVSLQRNGVVNFNRISNMKNKLMSVYDKIMLRKRSVIKCVMDSLKNICQAEHSRHRSLQGFIINVFAAIGAYHLLPKKPAIASQFQTDLTPFLQLSL
jgi:hypothetical protein